MAGCGSRRSHGTRERLRALAVACALASALLLTPVARPVPADRAPTPFMLIFDGAHEPGVGQVNPRRKGEFSAAAPICSTGAAIDEAFVYPNGVLREHTCNDGSGSFTARLDPTVAERGGSGRWKIVGGTGRYSELRGRGTFTGEFLGGSPSHEETITFRTTWEGVVGFDDTAPTIRALRSSLTKLRSPGSYVLRVSFRVADDVPGNAVEYSIIPRSGSYALPFSEGHARSRTVAVALQVDPRRPDLPVLVEISVTDPLGNNRRVLRSVRLPR